MQRELEVLDVMTANRDRRVWAGHWGETPDFGRKFNDAYLFFKSDTPSDWRRQFLAQSGITHIFAGPDERVLQQIVEEEQYPYLLRTYAGTVETTGVSIRNFYHRQVKRPL